jgi:hypothetical protein
LFNAKYLKKLRYPLTRKKNKMEKADTVIAVFSDHQAAEVAVKKLAQDGYEMKSLSIIGKGYHIDEKVVGFYNIGDRVKFWGLRGAFWGGLWGLFFGGIFLTLPMTGSVVILGFLANITIGAIDNAVIVGGLSAIGAAIYSVGVPNDSIVQYEADIKADQFLVMAHGEASEVARAKEILGTIKPSRLNVYSIRKALRAA